jgi:integrase
MANTIATKGTGGRPATGSIVWEDPETKTKPIAIRVTLPNGKRKLVPLPPGTTAEEGEALRPVLAERARFAVDDHAGETVAERGPRWCDWRDSSGLSCAQGDRARLALHVYPVIGAMEIEADASDLRPQLKRLVLILDANARRGFTVDANEKRRPFSHKTAVNVWATVCALFRDAYRAKDPNFCVRDDDPTEGIAGPDPGPEKAKTYLWPSEFLKLVTCELVPQRWRRLFALAVYTYARASELALLEWSDVDLEHGTILIHVANDAVRKRKKDTKTHLARRIPMEPALLPLLQALHVESKGCGRVLRMPPAGKLSTKLKEFLRRAGVTRADLFTNDATRKALRFHDLRASGITWMGVRGDAPMKIMQRAGHRFFTTTQGYLREAENLAAGFGAVFPSLPPELLEKPTTRRKVSAVVSAFGLPRTLDPAKNKLDIVGARGFEPPTPRSRTECATRLRYAPYHRPVSRSDSVRDARARAAAPYDGRFLLRQRDNAISLHDALSRVSSGAVSVPCIRKGWKNFHGDLHEVDFAGIVVL